ncbi:type II toxin-antitoxin system PemK/MazF family toxin [soil metagenome]
MTSSRPVPAQGEIWDAYLDPVIGHEQAGRRPVLIISNHAFNSLASSLCIIAPITSRSRGIALHVPVPKGEGGLDTTSFVLCDQVRSISHLRLRRLRGQLSPDVVEMVNTVVSLILFAE